MEVNDKVKYQKSRYIVKKWESEFKLSKGIAPSKVDIKDAPKRVKDAYSSYWKLKTILLESTLIDATIDENAKDCFSLPEFQIAKLNPLPCSDASSCQPSSLLQTSDSASTLHLHDSTNQLRTSGDASKLQSSLDESLLKISCKPSKINTSSDGNTLDKSENASLIQETGDEVSRLKQLEDSLPVVSRKSSKSVSNTKLLQNSSKDSKVNVKGEKSVWGSHLSIGAGKNTRSLKERSVSFQYSEKLFAGAKFSSRNPRKPGSFRRSKTFDSLPDANSGDVSFGAVDQEGTVNSGLSAAERVNVDENTVRSTEIDPEHGATNSADASKSTTGNNNFSPGHFNLKSEVKRVIIKEAPRVHYQGVSAVGAMLQDRSNPNKRLARHVDSGWLGRLDSDSGIASNSGHTGDRSDQDEDSDDVICDSDEESKSRFNLTSGSVKRCSDSGECENNSSMILKDSGAGEIKLTHKTSSNDSLIKHNTDIPPSNAVSTCIKSKGIDSSSSNKSILSSARIKRTRKDDDFQSGTVLTNSLKPPAKKIKLEIATPAVQANRARAAKKQAALEKKVSSGEANKNFVRIDIQKKVYTRGKKGMNFSNFKKKQWKELKGLNTSGIIKCFKCGDVGHMARQCKGVGDLLPHEEYEEESIFPSLEEAEAAAAKQAEQLAVNRSSRTQLKSCESSLPPPEDDEPESVEPIFSISPDGSLPDTPEEVYEALRSLGHSSFLPGQEEAIMTVLCGKSCLVVMPTGSGKSLCYRLPALLFHRHRQGCLTLVISPLVSLMEDQVVSSGDTGVGCLHHCQTKKQRSAVEDRLAARELSVLLVSPEMLSRDSSLSLGSRLPPIAFACIDEAHCLSHWSHNFRPSYLTLCQVLREKFRVKTLLGLTASVTTRTADSVVAALNGENGLTQGPTCTVSLIRAQRFLPENLVLSASRDINRDSAILSLLAAPRFASCSSIIVYCTRREECTRVASLLRTHLQDGRGNGTKSRLNCNAEVYHAGLTAAKRKQVQNAFMSGKVRIVVATVAFGMGINKRDLRGVIHYNMPASLENYLQEVGRAGRDGLPAHCHLFLSPESGDISELKRHIYSSSVDRSTLRRLLELVSSKCTGCAKTSHEMAVPIDSAVEELDQTQEVISTLLAYLAAAKSGYMLLPHAYTKARISSYKGSAHLAALASQCGVLGVGVAQAKAAGNKIKSSVELDVIKLSDSVGWNSGQVKNTLKQLEWIKSEEGAWSRSGLNVEFNELGFRLLVPCHLTDDQLDNVLNVLHKRATDHEETALKQLHFLHSCLQAVSYAEVVACCEEVSNDRREKLAASVHEYFTSATALDCVSIEEKSLDCEDDVIESIRNLVNSDREVQWTSRAIARILHGISSPRFPAIAWARTPYWRRHLNRDFSAVMKTASHHLRYST